MRRETSVSVVVLLFFGLTPFILHSVGTTHRRILEGLQIIPLSQPSQAATEWTSRSTYGRVLYLFDRELHASSEDRASSDNNFVLRAALEGTVRTIHHIVSAEDWNRAEGRLSGEKDFSRIEDGFKGQLKGVPLFVDPLSAHPLPHEPVLVHIDASSWTPSEREDILVLLGTEKIPADIVTVIDNTGSSFVTTLQRKLQ